MKKAILVISLALAVALTICPVTVQSQPASFRGGQGYGMGPGMMGWYGYGYGIGPGMMDGWGWVYVPSKLPAPKNTEWVQKLREILVQEKQSLAQYEADQEKFNAFMPYVMVIPQEENHIYWLDQLFSAYGLPSDGKVSPVVPSGSLTEAYQFAVKLEADLLPRYEWLVRNAEDRDSAQALNTILIQSRHHLVMFEHAMRMGHGYGFSRGMGIMGGYGPGYGMGPGIMGPGYGGYGMSPRAMWGGYGPKYGTPAKPLEKKDAKAAAEDYLKASGNPNLKVGSIKDAGNAFEVEIVTKNNSLVDKVLVDKNTGWIRPGYRE